MAGTKTTLTILIWISIALCAGKAGTPSDTFRLANQAFEAGNIEDAIMLYESIASSGYESAALYFNLGTAHTQKNQWAPARLYLEKALWIDPTEKRVALRLENVKEQIDDLYHFPVFPLTGVIRQIHGGLGKNAISTLLLLVFTALLSLFWFKPNQWKYYTLGLGTAFLVLISLLLLEINYTKRHHQLHIIWKDTALLEKPDDSSTELTSLSAGYKIRILEEVGPWFRIDLADGTEGWVRNEGLRSLL